MRIILFITLVSIFNFQFMHASDLEQKQNDLKECIEEVELQYNEDLISGEISKKEFKELLQECKRENK